MMSLFAKSVLNPPFLSVQCTVVSLLRTCYSSYFPIVFITFLYLTVFLLVSSWFTFSTCLLSSFLLSIVLSHPFSQLTRYKSQYLSSDPFGGHNVLWFRSWKLLGLTSLKNTRKSWAQLRPKASPFDTSVNTETLMLARHTIRLCDDYLKKQILC